MKNCPNCKSEVEDNFNLCWNCNYSFSENKVVEFEDIEDKQSVKEIDCLRCKVPLGFSGNFKFHEGTRFGVFGNVFEAFTNRESFDLYICPKCGKVEFFSPEIQVSYVLFDNIEMKEIELNSSRFALYG